LELTGDLTSAATATATTVGPAIVLTGRTAYVANQVLELVGGMLQAHLNVEAIRHWANPSPRRRSEVSSPLPAAGLDSSRGPRRGRRLGPGLSH
jgi:hypothetical protein